MEKRQGINKKYYESTKEHCSICKIDVSKAGKAYHLTSKKHLENLEKMKEDFNAISILEVTLEKLKAAPTNSKDICIELIKTLSTLVQYEPIKSQEPIQLPVKEIVEVVEKEVLEKPKKIIIKKKVPVVDKDCANTIENALTIEAPLSTENLDFLEEKWKEATKEVEYEEFNFGRGKITKTHTEMVPYIYTKMYNWIDRKISIDEEVTFETYNELNAIIIDKCLTDETDTNLEEKQKKVIRFCYWKMLLEQGWKEKLISKNI
jgi:hypothetical protein